MRSLLAKVKILLILLIGLSFLLNVSSCKLAGFSEDNVPKLPCKVTGACDTAIKKWIVKFNKSNNVKVIYMGQNYMVSIPASALFADQSPRLLWPGYHVLNQVATFMKEFRKIAVTVTAYSSKYVSSEREHSLTLARARVVGEYLWTQGIDSRFIFTQGMGSDKPIAITTIGGDRGPNARIEITFRRAVA